MNSTLDDIHEELKLESIIAVISFEDGIGEYVYDFNLPKWAIAAEIMSVIVQLRQASSLIITSSVAVSDSSSVSIRCTNFNGSLYTGMQSVNIILSIKYYK